MSLDFYLTKVVTEEKEVFTANITHNICEMAEEAGIYKCLWRPYEIGAELAVDIIETLREGLAELKKDPVRFKKFDSPNGWGTYNDFVPWVEKVLQACIDNPDTKINASI